MKKIYLMFSEESGHYKIGISKHPSKRICELQTGNAEKIILINEYESSVATKIETALHNTYSYLRRNGEWFELGLEQELNFINDCKKIENNIIVTMSM